MRPLREKKTRSRNAANSKKLMAQLIAEIDSALMARNGRSQHLGASSVKESWASVGEVKDWADKLSSSKPINSLLSRSQHSTSHHARSISTSGSLIKGPCGSSVSSNIPTIESQERNSYIHGDDQVERKAMRNASTMVMTSSRRTNTMDITKIVSGSEEDESQTPPSPTRSLKKVATNAKSKGGKQSQKRDEQDEDCDSTSQLTQPPPSKQAKTALRSTSGTQHSGSGVNNKYIKDDLPPGCTTDNVWRQLYISALAHFAAGYGNPWSIPSEQFKSTLQEIWDAVYGGNIKHDVVTAGGPVFQIAKQSLNNWRGGFATAAVAVITTLFANDVDFSDAAQRIEFSKAMLKKNHFLFSQNKGTDSKAWSRLWRSSLVLQTFAHHFNYIQGQADVPTLEVKLVCRMLMLVSNSDVSFEAAKLGNVWTAVIPKGTRYEFNDTIWGSTTRHFWSQSRNCPRNNSCSWLRKPIDLVGDDSEYDDLFTFR
ncbi:hypothetical protein BS17DRAFT_806975, partial [Gyrodon lividus]